MIKRLIIPLFLIIISLSLSVNGDSVDSVTTFDNISINSLKNDEFWEFNYKKGDLYSVIDIDSKKALAIDAAKPLIRRINENGADYSLEKPIYFDSQLQFTTDEVPPEIERDDNDRSLDKLIVWLYASKNGVNSLNPGIFGEISPITNLVITANWLNEKVILTGKHIPTNYLTNVTLKPNTWHRLTIKAIDNIGNHASGFEVWLDEKQVCGTCDYSTKSVKNVYKFPSMATYVWSGNNKIKGAAFDGLGAINNVSFSTSAREFAKAPCINGEEAQNEDQFIAKAKSDAVITVSKTWKVIGNALMRNNGDKFCDFAHFYDVNLAEGAISLTLNDKARPEIRGISLKTSENGEDSAAKVTISVKNAQPGLFYALCAYSDATCANKVAQLGEWVESTDEMIDLTVPKPKNNDNIINAAFFKVVVKDVIK